VIVGDGLAYVEEAAARGDRFDVVLIDSTDPVDAAVELFTEKFYRACGQLIGDTGILVPQSDSPVLCMGRTHANYQRLAGIFAHAVPYLGQTVAYPGGMWCFIAASNGVDARAVQWDDARMERLEPALRYVNRDVLRGAFLLPTYVRRGLAGEPGVDLPAISDDPETFESR
jgi:spermidine synthase